MRLAIAILAVLALWSLPFAARWGAMRQAELDRKQWHVEPHEVADKMGAIYAAAYGVCVRDEGDALRVAPTHMYVGELYTPTFDVPCSIFWSPLMTVETSGSITVQPNPIHSVFMIDREVCLKYPDECPEDDHDATAHY